MATNTTIARPDTSQAKLQQIYAETGGLSGRPLRSRSTDVIRHLRRQTGGRLPIIGVGGIFDAADAWEKITAGASLVQVYTGLVYEGPAVAGDIVRGDVIVATSNSASYIYDDSTPKRSLDAFVGLTRNFQHWFRDPMGGGAAFNTSNAYQIVLVP